MSTGSGGPAVDEAVRTLLLLMPRIVGRAKRLPIPPALQGLDLAPRHLALLAHLEYDGPASVSDLAARLEVAPTTISLMVSDLSKLGVLERAADPADRRRRIVAIAPRLRRADRRMALRQRVRLGARHARPGPGRTRHGDRRATRLRGRPGTGPRRPSVTSSRSGAGQAKPPPVKGLEGGHVVRGPRGAGPRTRSKKPGLRGWRGGRGAGRSRRGPGGPWRARSRPRP
ncbi:MarR family winged helix-turn-helix transcriptional regulator [Actinomadura madurae]|uniref:MarR family winged helix-turn-helix transcriptional regulator n=1 Tax=Actinomadura madurae TaxID=1993 RepID=UPI0020D228A5|nr:MarR family winged helix-turn-helix transcriptional regulator [Actinomadura madurae]MCQ0017732.1 MarR family winged helix-turn-helix transcriptional regulator [Actinomadura madurae]